jgi:hypothetical protein
MFIDIDCAQRKKYNQNAYGDYFTSKRYQDTGRLIAVLSDGLGSGVKANILASMTATMLLKFIEAETDIKKAAEIVLNSLPVCQVRKISYSTFSALDCDDEGNVKPKTIGKLLDDKVNIQGMFTICLRSMFDNGNYIFRLKTNGQDCVKTPIGLFEEEQMENDLKLVDTKIREYYDLDKKEEGEEK